MKKYLSTCVLFLLTGCMAVPVNSVMNVCPLAADITGYAFYDAQPPAGAEIVPTQGKDGVEEWMLPDNAYLQCRYKDGSTVVQRLPVSIDRCRIKGQQLVCTAWI